MPQRALINRILVAIDGSENSRKALDVALYLAKKLRGEVTALSIVDNSSLATLSEDVATYPLYETLQSLAQRVLEDARRVGREKGTEVKTEVATGSPAHEILRLSENFDLVVVGTMGKTGLSYFLLGSVADKVVRRSKVPVLVVPLKKEES